MKENKKIITGNWGCGVFRGDPQIKLIIQWIAASLADKEILYCPYGQKRHIAHSKLNKLK
jgi:poly(ADP-ribose) glycohydrolase